MARGRASRRVVFNAGALAICGLLALTAIVAASPTGRVAEPTGLSSGGSVHLPVSPVTPTPLAAGQPARHTARALVAPFHTLSPGALRAAKIHAAAQLSVGQRTPQATVKLPLTGLFNGTNSGGLSDPSVTPPDSTGSIGPSNYVEMVNQQVGVYDRTLHLLSQTDTGTFTGASALDIVSDPQIQWDARAGRWLYAAVAVSQGDNALLFGWSKTSDPSDLSNGWCRFGFGRGSLLDDYPKLGHYDDYLLIGSNVYSDATGSYLFQTADLFAIPKPAPGDTSCIIPGTSWHFADASNPLLNLDGTPAYTPVPANTADASASGWVVAAHTPLSGDNVYLGPQTKLEVWHVLTSGGNPVLVADGAQAVPSFDIPAAAPQPGSANTLDTLDARLTQAVAVRDPAAGAEGVWTQHTVAGTGGRSVVRWYEIVGGAPPAIRQRGEVGSATDFIFNAAISPSIGGDSAAIFYNRTSATQLPIIGAQSRGPSTPLGAMDAGELILGTSTASDVDPSCSPTCRWGDYAGASPDPVNTGVVWGSSQVTGPCYLICGWFSQWQTRNFAVVASASTGPTVPGAPTLTGASAGNGSVTLSWSAPASDGGASVTNYEIYRGTTSGGEVKVAETGNVLSYPDTGLTNGTTYYYKVSAKNSVGEGALSNERSATPQTAATAPSAPTLLSATPGNGQVSLSWSAPTSNGGSAVTNYTILRGGSSSGETFLVTVGNVTSYIDAGLTNGATYFYEVEAMNAVGTGPASNELSATPVAPNFSISATPSSHSIARGGTATYSVALSPSGGFAGSVSLSASISPKAKGVSFSFSPSSLTVPGGTSSTLTVRTGKGTARGTYTVTITASGGGLTRTTTVTLIVN